MFHRQYPDKRIKVYHLRKEYRMAKIRKKKIKRTKVISEDKEWQRLGEAVEAYSGLEQHKAEGYRILYLDEVMTTKSTLPMFEWSALNDNMKVDLSQFSG